MRRLLLLLTTLVLTISSSYGQVISTFPYIEDFEAEATCGTGCGAICGSLIDWINPTTDDLDWLVHVGGTSSGNTGPSVDHTLGNATGKYVYVETSCSGTGYPNYRADLESPWFDFSAGLTMQLEFWYHAFGATQGPLNVEARVGALGAWTNIAGPIQDDQDLWQEWSGCFGPTFTGADSVQVRFVYVSGTSFTGDIGLDDISVSQVNQNDIAATLVLGPTGCGLGSSEAISIEICNSGDTIFSGTTIPVSYSVDGGTPVLDSVTIASDLLDICNGGGCLTYTFATGADLSGVGLHTITAWTNLSGDPVSINDTTTNTVNNIPVGGSLPYFENFEAGQGGWTIDNGTNGSWDFGTPNKAEIIGAASGDSCFVNGGLTAMYNANEDGSVTSPCIDISSATGAEVVTMKIWWSTEYSWDGANLFSSIDGGVNWSQVGNFGDPLNWYNDNSINGAPNGSQEGWTGDNLSGSNGWVCVTNDLDSTLMVDNDAILFRVGFGSDGSVQREGFAFDDFAVGLPATGYSMIPDSILACDTTAVVDLGAGFDWYSISTIGSGASGTITSQIDNLNSSNNGNLYVYVTDSLGMCQTDTFFLEVADFVAPTLMDMTLCTGDSAMFDAGADITGNTIYNWSNGDTLQTSWLFAPGMIAVDKLDTLSGCAASDSASLYYLTVALNDLTACAGDSAILDATSTSVDAMYDWNTGDSTSMITINTSGTYSVTVTDTVIGCSVLDSMDYIVNTLPIVDLGQDQTYCDTIDVTLDAGAFTNYLWSDSSTNQTLVVSTTGNYMVTVTDSNGCLGSDDVTIFFQDCSSLTELENGIEVTVFPNPSPGEFNYILSDMTKEVSYYVLDLSGKVILTGSLNSLEGKIDLSIFENGMYMLNLNTENSESIIRLIKQ